MYICRYICFDEIKLRVAQTYYYQTSSTNNIANIAKFSIKILCNYNADSLLHMF